MKIDITSMFFNSSIEGQTATPAWGTSIGQSKSRECRIDDVRKDVVDIVIGMTYKSVSNLDKLNVSKGSSDREILICSVFDRVFVNNTQIIGGKYCLLLVREHSKSHDGRLLISYAPYITYDGVSNQNCITMNDADVLKMMHQIITKIVAMELNLERELWQKSPDKIIDKVMRAWGILTNAHLLTSDEVVEQLVWIKLGIGFKILSFRNNRIVDELFFLTKPATIINNYHLQNASQVERDKKRAEEVRGKLLFFRMK